MAPKKFPQAELRKPFKMEAWLIAKDSAFATSVGLGKFYIEEWRFTHEQTSPGMASQLTCDRIHFTSEGSARLIEP